MAIEAGFNNRPVRKSGYKHGKKEALPIRILKGLFPVKGDSAFEVVRKLIFIGAFGAFIYFGGTVLLDLGNDYIQTKKADDYLAKVVGEMNIPKEVVDEVKEKVPTIQPDFIQAYYDNNDFVGHIRINNVNLNEGDADKYIIDYLVYQAEDNEYYLDHAFDHTFNKGGAIFADHHNNFKDGNMSGNTILYGHNIITQKYFTLLSRYYTGYDSVRGKDDDLDFYKDHPVVTFDTLYEKGEWEVFAVALLNTQEKYGDVFDYVNVFDFQNRDTFNEFILGIMDRSVLFTDVDLKYGDRILTLSTCYYPYGDNVDTRCVVFARKVRDGEQVKVDVSKAQSNYKEFRFEEQAKRIGTSWTGRVWDTSYLINN